MKQRNKKINFIPNQIFIIFLLSLSLLSLSNSKCYDRPQCFKKLMFNFNFPQMNMFQINGTTDQFTQYSIKAYGDFNNDLYTDYIGINEKREIFVFAWNSDSSIYEKVYEMTMIDNIIPKRIYLLDISGDGKLDFVIWGNLLPSSNSSLANQLQDHLVPFVRQDDQGNKYVFKNTNKISMPKTTDPIVIGHDFNSNVDGVGFLVFMNGTRTFLIYRAQEKGDPIFEPVKWSDMATGQSQYAIKNFKDPHWNTFLDITGDCKPDLILLNSDNIIEFWINNDKKFKLFKQQHIDPQIKGLKLMGLTFSEINYDGSIDMVLAYENFFEIHLNQKSLTAESQFCCQKCTDFYLNQPIRIYIPNDKSIKPQSLHFGDINIDGYPDLLLTLIDKQDNKQTPVLFENQFDEDKNSFSPFEKPIYNNRLASTPTNSQVVSASFIDILQNGILDIIITYSNSGKLSTVMFYNNFLCQNDYYIKGFGLLGPTIDQGSQFPGMSFYWVNSVNDGFKITYQAQMIQTAYDALQMPYTFSGLGKANNYVQSFTIGRNGKKQQWSPIIPNSQLGVFTINGQQQKWKIRIFAFPLEELIGVIIVTAIILATFGVFLMYSKCKNYNKKDQPLLVQFIS